MGERKRRLLGSLLAVCLLLGQATEGVVFAKEAPKVELPTEVELQAEEMISEGEITVSVGDVTYASAEPDENGWIHSTEYPDYYYTMINDREIELVDYIGEETVVEVPAQMDGYQVTALYFVFEDSEVTEVMIPEGVTRMRNTFTEAKKLEKVSLPETLIELDYFTFESCKNLSEIILPESLEIIGQRVFADCDSLTEIRIPAKALVDWKAMSPFWGCDNLTTIELGGDEVTVLPSSLYQGVYGLRSITIPEGITEIGERVFESCINLTEVVLPEGITEIAEGTFQNCTSLTKVVLPEGLTRIGDYAFSECVSLEEIQLPDTLERIEVYAFNGAGLKELVVPDSVIVINYGAFGYCNNLRKVKLSQNLIGLGSYCFDSVKLTEELEIPKSLTQCKTTPFNGCEVQKVVFQEGAVQVVPGLLESCLMEEVVLSDTVTEIGAAAFSKATRLKKITGLDHVTVVGENAFFDCSSLPEIAFLKVETIGASGFAGCKQLKQVYLPPSLSEIGEACFQNCSQMEYLTVPESVTTIGSKTFETCMNLKEIELWEGLTQIAEDAFADIKNIVICAPEGSYAQSYAEEKNFTYKRRIPVKELQVGETDITIQVSERYGLETEVSPATATDTVRYYNLNPEVATVNTEGVITGIAEGSACIWVFAGSQFQICNVTVASSELDDTFVRMRVGEQTELTIPWEVKEYTSSDEAIVTVTQTGIMTACEQGNATITVTLAEGRTLTCQVWVWGYVDIPMEAESSFTYEVMWDGTATITGYKGVATAFEIPETLDGYVVSAIDDQVFENRTTLTEIVFPGTIKTIGYRGFYNCNRLTNLWLPPQIESLGNAVFYNCDSLTSVFIPASTSGKDFLEENGKKPGAVFENCDNLTEITFEEGTTTVYPGLVADCPKLSRLNFPESVLYLGTKSFWNCDGLTELELPSKLVGMGQATFAYCDGITEITIPETLRYSMVRSRMDVDGVWWFDPGVIFDESQKTWACGPFSFCSNLKKVTLPEHMEKIPVGLFQRCTGLEEIVIPDTVTVIETAAFAGCKSLKQLTIPDSVTWIQDSAFAYIGIEDLVLPGKLESLELYAFYGCKELKQVFIPKSLDYAPLSHNVYPNTDPVMYGNIGGPFAQCEKLQNVIFDEGIENIPYGLFAASALKRIEIPNTVKEIETCAFSSCENLEEVILPDSLRVIGLGAFGNTAYDYHADGSGCPKLKQITLPEHLEVMFEEAFAGSGLEEIVMPDSLQILGLSAFASCDNLTNVVWSKNLKYIGGYLFAGCSALTEITIPAHIQETKTYVEGDPLSEGVEETYVPLLVNSTPDYWFKGCENLKSVTLEPGAKKLNALFKSCDSLESIVIPSSVEELEVRIFLNCSNLKTVELSDNITTIPDGAFMYCASLEKINIPSKLESMKARAFCGCKSLNNIELPDGLVEIGSYAFAECYLLERMVIPGSVKALNAYQFLGCVKLKEVVLEHGVSNIVGSVFEGCGSLTDLTIPKTVIQIGSLFERTDLRGQLTIHGAEGTLAESYAKENGYAFEAYVIPLEKIILSAETINVVPGERSVYIRVERFEPEDFTSMEPLIWESSDPDNCIIWAEELGRTCEVTSWDYYGTAEVKVSLGDVSAVCVVNMVHALTDEIEVFPKKLSMTESSDPLHREQIIAQVEPYNALYEFDYTSSDETVATVDEEGWVTPVGEGEAVITVWTKDGSGLSATCEVSVGLWPYAIIYDLKGGSWPEGYTPCYNFTRKSETIYLGTPSKNNYTFGGWYTDCDYKNKITEIPTGSIDDYVVYAKWLPNQYNIAFHGNGATSGKMNPLRDCKLDTSYTLAANAYKRKGYTFVGWNTEANGTGTAYQNKASVENLTSINGKTITLYAQWKKDTYKITYKLSGGKNHKSNPATYMVTSAITLKKPTRTGYTFAGWYSDSKYKTKVSKIFKGTTGKKTLYAKWTPNKYTINFHGNGATSGKMSSLKNRKYGTSYKLTANKFKKKGYQFAGWNTKKNGKGKTYKNKASVKNLVSANGKTITLYAQWVKDKKKE